jgi:hypothetical protein
MIEALVDEPLLHDVMGACRDIIHELLKPRDLVPEGIGFAKRKNLAKNALEHFSRVDTASLLE